jgi:hypothetical protein
MITGPFFIVLYVAIGVLLLAFAYSLFSRPTRKAKPKAAKRTPIGLCPICRSELVNGEQIKTALFPGEKDRLCHIFGCPHCHPYIEEGLSRHCPVCKKKLPEEDYLVARLFDRAGGKHHVHIVGCTNCRPSAKSRS